MSNLSDPDISRAASHALRHEPWLYEIELDDEGFTDITVFVEALRNADPRFGELERADVERMVAGASKQRHEIVGDRIRALYGHSLPGAIRKVEAVPPEVLFHGTSARFIDVILAEGLRPMQRQYVHLSVDVAMAEQVGSRKPGDLVVLTVRAREAHEAGVRFLIGNGKQAKHVRGAQNFLPGRSELIADPKIC